MQLTERLLAKQTVEKPEQQSSGLVPDQQAFVDSVMDKIQSFLIRPNFTTARTSPNYPAVDQLRKRYSDSELQTETIDGYKIDSYLSILAEAQIQILQGCAGTGKTTTLARLLCLIAVKHPGLIQDLVFVCATGKAAARAKEALNEALADEPESVKTLLAPLAPTTVHDYLKFGPAEFSYEDKKTCECKTSQIFVPKFTALTPHSSKIVILDEMSMAGLKLNYQLVSAHNLHRTLFIYVGDINQTTSVADTPAAVRLMYVQPDSNLHILNKVHRYSGYILEQAHAVMNGIPPKPDGKSILELRVSDYAHTAHDEIVEFITGSYKEGLYDPDQDQIITTVNVGELGQESLNLAIQHRVDPQAREKFADIDLSYGNERTMHLGAKIIYTKNQRSWGLINGTQGKIIDIEPNPKYFGKKSTAVRGSAISTAPSKAIPFEHGMFPEIAPDISDLTDDGDEKNTQQASHKITIEFQHYSTGALTTQVLQTTAAIQNLLYGYACTVYKAQGSEYRNVFLLTHNSLRGINREYIYTAMTRVKSGKLILISEESPSVMRKGVKRQALLGNTIQAKIRNACGVNSLGKTKEGKL